MAASAPIGPGELVAGKYRAVRVLGAGGMGVVIEAFHERLAQHVAIKFMRGDAARDPAAVERFVREARAASKLKGPHVVRVLDAGDLEDGTPFIVMERLEGADVATLLAHTGALPAPAAVEIVRQACACMAEAHAAGIVHRDLKPQNLFVTHGSDGAPLVKVLDFGVSKLREEGAPTVTATDTTMGSPAYMAPEQMRAARQADARSDVWSLGVILYQLLSGKLPFPSESVPEVCAKVLGEPPVALREVAPSVPAELEDVVMGCLVKEARARTPGARELADSLAPWLEGGVAAVGAALEKWSKARQAADMGADTLPASAEAVERSPRPQLADRSTTPQRRRRWPWAVAGVTAAGVLAAALVHGGGGPGETRAPVDVADGGHAFLLARAEKLRDEAEAAASSGDYRLAGERLLLAYMTLPRGLYLWEAALSFKHHGDHARAIETFEVYIANTSADERPSHDEARAQIAALRGLQDAAPADAGLADAAPAPRAAATPDAGPPKRPKPAAAPRPAAQPRPVVTDDFLPAARRAFEEAQAAFERRDYDEAARGYLHCYAIYPRPAFLYNAAVCYEKLRDYRRAVEFYRRYLQDLPGATDRRDVETRISALEREIAQSSADAGPPR